ncbi:MAG: hypothetical protein ACYDHC_08660 [Desulfuromonadaceae bacterium]
MKITLLYGIIAAVFSFTVSPVFAADISFSTPISQEDFKTLSKEAGAALGYRNMAPTEPLGITGFDIGAELSAVGIDNNSSYWNSAFGSDAPSYLVIPKIRARKGLPFGIDVGGMYSYVPNSNIKLYGAELSKSILEGTAATPALGVRATYTKLSGVSDLSLQTYGVDASVSKGFLFITPYAGAGMLWINSEAKGNLKTMAPALESESTTVPRLFAGVKITPFPLVGITVEAEYAERPIYSLKAAISF